MMGTIEQFGAFAGMVTRGANVSRVDFLVTPGGVFPMTRPPQDGERTETFMVVPGAISGATISMIADRLAA